MNAGLRPCVGMKNSRTWLARQEQVGSRPFKSDVMRGAVKTRRTSEVRILAFIPTEWRTHTYSIRRRHSEAL